MSKRIARRMILLSFCVTVALTAFHANVVIAQEKQTPKQQYDALLEEYNAKLKELQATQKDLLQRLRKAKTVEERTKIGRERINLIRNSPVTQLTPRFVKFANANAKSELGLSAMVWVMKNNPRDRNVGRFVKAMTEHHAASKEIAALLPGMQRAFGYNPEPLLRKVLEVNEDTEAKGIACFSLAGYLANKNRRATKPNPEIGELYERIVKEFGKVILNGRTLAKLVEAPLFEAKHLQIGMTVPDISAEDIDGKEFKLSDYRGKVVVIDFWGDW